MQGELVCTGSHSHEGRLTRLRHGVCDNTWWVGVTRGRWALPVRCGWGPRCAGGSELKRQHMSAWCLVCGVGGGLGSETMEGKVRRVPQELRSRIPTQSKTLFPLCEPGCVPWTRVCGPSCVLWVGEEGRVVRGAFCGWG